METLDTVNNLKTNLGSDIFKKFLKTIDQYLYDNDCVICLSENMVKSSLINEFSQTNIQEIALEFLNSTNSLDIDVDEFIIGFLIEELDNHLFNKEVVCYCNNDSFTLYLVPNIEELHSFKDKFNGFIDNILEHFEAATRTLLRTQNILLFNTNYVSTEISKACETILREHSVNITLKTLLTEHFKKNTFNYIDSVDIENFAQDLVVSDEYQVATYYDETQENIVDLFYCEDILNQEVFFKLNDSLKSIKENILNYINLLYSSEFNFENKNISENLLYHIYLLSSIETDEDILLFLEIILNDTAKKYTVDPMLFAIFARESALHEELVLHISKIVKNDN